MQAEADTQATVAALIPGNLVFFLGICEAGDTDIHGNCLVFEACQNPTFLQLHAPFLAVRMLDS